MQTLEPPTGTDASVHGSGAPASAFLLRHPAASGVAALLALSAAVLVGQAVQGRVPFGPGGERGSFESIVVHVLLVAYLPAAYLALISRARQRLALLGRAGARGGSEEPPPAGWSASAFLAAGVLGALLGVIGPYLTEPYNHTFVEFWQPTRWSPEVVWHRTLGVVGGTELGVFCFALVRSALDFSCVARRLDGIDIFDLGQLRPFMQQGLTSGLLAAGMLSLIGLFSLGKGINPMVVLLECGSIALVSLALALPVRGVRRRIRAAKQAELARCEAAIERERRHALDGGERAPSGRLGDLLAYRSLVREVREWPFDTPALGRIALYLLIPLGSWVASAVVQHMVERAIAK